MGGGQHLSASEVENDVPQTRAVACSWSGNAGSSTDGVNYCKTSTGRKVEARRWEGGFITVQTYYDQDSANKVDYKYKFKSARVKDTYENWNAGYRIAEYTYERIGTDDKIKSKRFYNSTGKILTKYETWSNGKITRRTTYYSNGNMNVHTTYNSGVKIQENVYNSSTGRVNEKTFWNTGGTKTKYETWSYGKIDTRTTYYSNGNRNVHNIYDAEELIQQNTYLKNKVNTKTFWNTSGTKTRYEKWNDGNKEHVDYYTKGIMAYRDYYTNGKRTSRKSFETFKPQMKIYDVTCKYGNVCYPGHNGTDVQSIQLSYTQTNSYNQVIAVASGKVVDTGSGCSLEYREDANCNFGMGNYVTINHGEGRETIYMHLQGPKVNVGDYIVQGDYIGTEGASGDVHGKTGIHSHISYLVNDVYKNPENVISYNLKQRSHIAETDKESIEENIDYEGYLKHLKKLKQHEENSEN